ncbi:MAG: FAS1-like dehydratase domain-containing protein [Dehalococcoidia bacterium]
MTTSVSPDDTVISEELRSFIDLESNAVTYEIERHAVERFACAIGDTNPFYTNKPYPEPFAHILDGGSKYRYNEPVRVGDQITVVRKITDLFEKDGRMGTMLFKISEISYTNQEGRLVATQTTTTITYGTGAKDSGVGNH